MKHLPIYLGRKTDPGCKYNDFKNETDPGLNFFFLIGTKLFLNYIYYSFYFLVFFLYDSLNDEIALSMIGS